MTEAEANKLLIEQLKRHLAEALEENDEHKQTIALYKAQEQRLLARLRISESSNSKIACRI